jgi:hypothetical protein
MGAHRGALRREPIVGMVSGGCMEQLEAVLDRFAGAEVLP